MAGAGSGEFERAMTALGSGDRATAEVSLAAAADLGHPGAHQLLAGFALSADSLAEARQHLEEAFRGFREGGALRAAVRVAVELANLHHSMLDNRHVAQGWLGRAHSLLERVGPCVEQGYVALAVVACDRPDAEDVERSADTAHRVALTYGDGDLEVRALADGGLALVTQGRLGEGFARLDRAMAALTAGEVQDVGVAGRSFCALLTACERAGDASRAREWTRLVDEVMQERFPAYPLVLRTHCRVALGSALCSAGRWTEAEVELGLALGAGSSASSYHRAVSLSVLASIRILQGRLEEASALLVGAHHNVDAALPLGRLHLLKGEPAVTVAVVQGAIEQLRGDRLRVVPLLSLLIEAELARDAPGPALEALEQLRSIDCGDLAVAAVHRLIGEARMAASRSDTTSAISSLTAACAAMGDGEQPVVRGTVLLELAEARSRTGERDRSVADARAALQIFDDLGAHLLHDRAAALLRHLGVTSRQGARATPPSPRDVLGLTPREREVLDLVRVGMTNAEIGARLFISAKTAEHHVGHVLTKLGVRSRAEAAAVATAAHAT